MRGRTAIAMTAHRLRPAAIGWGLITVLTCVALSACTAAATGTTSGPTSSVSSYSPSVSGSASGSNSPSSPTPSSSYSPPPTPSFSPIPTAPPGTGGGGTAGFEDAGLAVLGGAAIAAGLGSIAYRRRITRRR